MVAFNFSQLPQNGNPKMKRRPQAAGIHREFPMA
jgi:hypothetical protein